MENDMRLFFPMNPKDLKDWSKVEVLLDDPQWALQLKRDGVRGIIHFTESGNRIFGRKAGKSDNKRPLEMTHNLPSLANKQMPTALLGLSMDCEIYCPGKTSAEIAGAVNPNRVDSPVDWEEDIEYWVFDIPTLYGKENPYPFIQRAHLLDMIFTSYGWAKYPIYLKPLCHVSTIFENKRESLQAWLQNGEEGGVLKKLDSPYLFSYDTEGKRSTQTWVKAKKAFDADYIITGFQEPEKEYTGKYLESWTYWETDLGVKYYGEKRSSGDIPTTKFYHYGWIGAIEYGLWMHQDQFKKYQPENSNMRVIATDGPMVLTPLGFTSGFSEDLRLKISINPQDYEGKVVRIGGMMINPDTLAVRHPALDMIRWDKDPKECRLE